MVKIRKQLFSAVTALVFFITAVLSVSADTTTAPPAFAAGIVVSDVTAAQSATAINVKWNAVDSARYAVYYVYTDNVTGAFGDWTVKAVDTPSYVIPLPVKGVTYHITILPFIDVPSRQYGGFSSYVQVRTAAESTADLAKAAATAKNYQGEVRINGIDKYFNAYNIGGGRYFKINDISRMLSGTTKQFSVNISATDKVITLTKGKSYIPGVTVAGNNTQSAVKPVLSDFKVLFGGARLGMTVYNAGGESYVKITDVGALFDFPLGWLEATDTIIINTNDGSAIVNADFNDDNGATSQFPRWSEPVKSYIINNNDGTVTAVEFGGKGTAVATYGADGMIKSAKQLPAELPKFGTVLSGATYNYIAYGQDNPTENSDLEVIRIVKYDKAWNRVSAIRVDHCYTIKPFDKACQMAESGDTLVLHTARTRYKTEDGLNHQSQLTIFANTSTMQVVNQDDIVPFQSNHVSHSFDQRVLFDGTKAVLLDHGDAYPRSVVLHKQGDGYKFGEGIPLFNIPGEVGANCTGVTVGGFEMPTDKYIAAITTIDPSKVTSYTSYEMVGLTLDQRDILLLTFSRDNYAADAGKNQVLLAKYIGTDKIASTPQLVKVNDNKFAVMWQEFSLDGKVRGDLKYVFVDGNGQALGSVRSEKAVLSEVKPIVVDGNITWYANVDGLRTFYSIKAQ